MRKVAIIGAGNWGTALSIALAGIGHPVRLWAYEREVVESILARGENELFMPGVELPESVRPTNALQEALEDAEIVLTVTPSHVCRVLYEQMLDYLRPEMFFVSATKGIDTERLMRPSEIITSVVGPRFPPRLAVLSGPSFAREVARGAPTAVVVASRDRAAARMVQREFSSRVLRLYTSSDVIGVELGGSVKNVIAIAAGISDGLGLGQNARAALITRGLAEMTRLAVRMGANPMTLSGLPGLGDLVLTCAGDLSRNRKAGLQIAQGKSLQEITEESRMVAEGIRNTRSVYLLARHLDVEMPIVEQMHRVLYESKNPFEAVGDLMQRSFKPEIS